MKDINAYPTPRTLKLGPIRFRDFLLLSSASLERLPQGVRGYYGTDRGLVYHDFSKAELERIDPRLPGVLEVRFFQQTDPTSLLPTDWVVNTLDYWANPLNIITTAGNPIALVSVTGVKNFYPVSKEMQLQAIRYQLSYDDAVPFVVDTKWIDFFVSHAELEKHFPGWEVRYNLLSSVGTVEKELVKQVFCKMDVQPPSVTMTDLDFE